MAVGGQAMLCTSNYIARKFGVRAAMPGFIAKKLCPNLVIVPTDIPKYKAVSKQVRKILNSFCPKGNHHAIWYNQFTWRLFLALWGCRTRSQKEWFNLNSLLTFNNEWHKNNLYGTNTFFYIPLMRSLQNSLYFVCIWNFYSDNL